MKGRRLKPYSFQEEKEEEQEEEKEGRRQSTELSTSRASLYPLPGWSLS